VTARTGGRQVVRSEHLRAAVGWLRRTPVLLISCWPFQHHPYHLPNPSPPPEKAARKASKEYPTERCCGANLFTYFVCNELAGALQRLDDVTPEQIRAARTLKRFLTGRLHAGVSTYPPFPGTEAAFLRAQIARISATTVLAPADWFVAEDDDEGRPVVTRAEEITPVALPEAGAASEWLASWVHRCGSCVGA